MYSKLSESESESVSPFSPLSIKGRSAIETTLFRSQTIYFCVQCYVTVKYAQFMLIEYVILFCRDLI